MHFAQGVHQVNLVQSDEENSDQEEEGEVKDDDSSYIPDPHKISGHNNNDNQNDNDTDDLHE